MKKILYISDYTLDCFNSVRDILYNLVTSKEMAAFEHVVVKSTGAMHSSIRVDYYEGIKNYSSIMSNAAECANQKECSLIRKIDHVIYKILHYIFKALRMTHILTHYDNIAYIKEIIKKERPHAVVFLTYTPMKNYARYCKKRKIPYISILYDTYIGRPNINIKCAHRLEKEVIENAKGYFVPSFFYELYQKMYKSDAIQSYNLPLLIPKENVLKAYQNRPHKTEFVYFGQIQSFRNGETIKKLFRTLGIQLDVYTTERYKSDETFVIHKAVTKDELYEIVAGSRFLVALDNSAPFQDYLPSKAYLYASFTKPVIAFGDNDKSALISFFEDYPWFYYQNINEPTDGLIDFLSNDFPTMHDEETYSRYLHFLPDNALRPLIACIKKNLH